MVRHISIFIFLHLVIPQDAIFGQVGKLWTDADRNYLVSNLERTKQEIIIETKNLSLQQWSYKADSTNWSIAQVLEHLGLYERIFMQEADIMLSSVPEPNLSAAALPDTSYINWMNDPGPHKAEWNADPMGFMEGSNNLSFFLYGRNNIIHFVSTTTYDLKAHYTYRWGNEKRRSIHALMVVHFAHTDRHLRQIKRIKAFENFPR